MRLSTKNQSTYQSRFEIAFQSIRKKQSMQIDTLLNVFGNSEVPDFCFKSNRKSME